MIKIIQLIEDYVILSKSFSDIFNLDIASSESKISILFANTFNELEDISDMLISNLEELICKNSDEENFDIISNHMIRRYTSSRNTDFLYLLALIENNSQINNQNIRVFISNEIIKIQDVNELENKGLFSSFDTLVRFNPEDIKELDLKNLLDFFFRTPEEKLWNQRYFYHITLFKFLERELKEEFRNRFEKCNNEELKELLDKYPN